MKWLAELASQLQAEPTLDGYRRYLLSLLAYRRRQRELRTKTQMAADFLRQAIAWRLPFDTVLFDGWYCRWPLIQVVQEVRKDLVSGCPKDRKVLFRGRWVQLQDCIMTIPAEAYRTPGIVARFRGIDKPPAADRR